MNTNAAMSEVFVGLKVKVRDQLTQIVREMSIQKLQVDVLLEVESKVKAQTSRRKASHGAIASRGSQGQSGDKAKKTSPDDLLSGELSETAFEQIHSYKQLLAMTTE